MTDQTPADLADKVRKLAARFRQQMDPHAPVGEYAVWECAAEAVETLLSPPPRPTLADMTEEERVECQWMQADVKGYESRVVIVNPYWEDGRARVMWLHTRMNPVSWKSVTPRPDLPRLEWPSEAPVPESTLDEGSVWEDVDALNLACEESGRDQIAVTDKNGDVSVWGAYKDWWETGAPDLGFEPFTIIHAGKKADN